MVFRKKYLEINSISLCVSIKLILSFFLFNISNIFVLKLFSERILEQFEPNSPTPISSTSKNPYTSTLTVVQKLISENKQLIELNVNYFFLLLFLSHHIHHANSLTSLINRL